MRTNRSKGFTFIEFLIVVVFIGILAAIAIPNFITMQNRAKDSTTKSNMYDVQLACEDYALQHDERYSTDPEKIEPLVSSSAKNPWTGKPVHLVTYFLNMSGTYERGAIMLSPPMRDGVIVVDAGGYLIRGVGWDGKLMSLELTNAEPDTTPHLKPGIH